MLLSLVVAIVPVFPVETYVVGMAVATRGWAVPIGIAAGLGQAAGKLLVFLGIRGAVKSAWIQRLTSRWSKAPTSTPSTLARRALAMLDRPGLAAPIVFLSAGTGIPPLTIVVFYAARTKMSSAVFFLVTLAGRSIWFIVIALMPSLILS